MQTLKELKQELNTARFDAMYFSDPETVIEPNALFNVKESLELKKTLAAKAMAKIEVLKFRIEQFNK